MSHHSIMFKCELYPSWCVNICRLNFKLEPCEIIQVNIWDCYLHLVWRQWAYLTWEEAEIMYLNMSKLVYSILDETRTIKEWLHIKIFPDYIHHCNIFNCVWIVWSVPFFSNYPGNAYCWNILLIPKFYVITSYSSRLRTACMKFKDWSGCMHEIYR